MKIVVVTARAGKMQAFAETLSKKTGGETVFAATGAEALEMAGTLSLSFMVVDEGLPDMEPLALVKDLVMVNAMINTAVVSSMDPEEFHEESEGLGVLAPVPSDPTGEDGAALAEVFRRFI